MQRRQLAAALQVHDVERLRAGTTRLAELGYAPSEETLALLAAELPEADMAALRLRFDANRSVVQASRLFATVPAGGRLIEGIAWDPRRDRLFVTAVVGRELLYGDGRTWRAVPRLQAGSLFGLALDDHRRRLWIASGAMEQTPSPETAFKGLIALDLDSLRVVQRVPIEDGGSPADIAVGHDGTVYASDPVRGTIYRLGLGDSAVTIVVPPGRLGNPQGLVPSLDRARLYVSDYGFGLAVVDLDSGNVTRLDSDVPTMLDGIDGLVPWRGGLIAVQNGTNPRRILQLALSEDGLRITAMRILESSHPEWGAPTLGIVRGDGFVYVADAQWERYGTAGTVIGEGPTRPTAIRELRLPD
jgi:hypothetical protein